MVSNADIQLPGNPQTANEALFDALIRHQVGLMRLTGSIRNQVNDLLNETEQDIASTIKRRLANQAGAPTTPSAVRRLRRLQRAVGLTRTGAWNQIAKLWLAELTRVSQAEVVTADNILRAASPVVLSTTLPSNEFLASIVKSRPFEGRTLRQWAQSIAATDIRRIQDQISIGLTQGETGPAIARRVVGTARRRGFDGVTQITRREAEAITRTAVTAITNFAKREFYMANATELTREVYVATLDSRVTILCAGYDGNIYPVGEGPLPPVHFNCRSVRVAVISGQVIGQRPAKASTQRMLLREFSRKEGIPTVASRADLPRGTKAAFDVFSRRRIRELTGRVPAKVSYQEWLGRQSASFQDDVLGMTKGKLFRQGKLPLERFVNRRGDELTLSELATRDRQAFIDAGLDPDNI